MYAFRCTIFFALQSADDIKGEEGEGKSEVRKSQEMKKGAWGVSFSWHAIATFSLHSGAGQALFPLQRLGLSVLPPENPDLPLGRRKHLQINT